MDRMFLGCAILATLSMGVISELNCTSSCEGYKHCTSLQNQTEVTAFLNNSMSCSADNDAKLGALFGYMDECRMTQAAIEVADLMNIAWDGVSPIEDLMEDEEFWLDTCEWSHIAAAACVYHSLPDDSTCTNNSTIQKSGMFCAGECMKIASSCLNLGKYKQLNESVTSFCDDYTSLNSETCYKAQFSNPGLVKPACNADVKSVSLLGPYVVGAVGLALAVVALIGLALITCRKADGGAPNSF